MQKLTEAQCKRNEDGARTRTGQDSRMQAVIASACRNHDRVLGNSPPAQF